MLNSLTTVSQLLTILSRTGLNFFQVLFTTTRFSSVLSCEDLLISSFEVYTILIQDCCYISAHQDLAVSPGIRDPRMNTAECVIEGHGIDREATGRSVYIKVIHWCSLLFTLAISIY